MVLRTLRSIVMTGILSLLISASYAQSFSLDTIVAQNANQYDYSFTLNYDQAGQVQTLMDSIYDWSFSLDPGTPEPTNILSPTGWKSSYDMASGLFDFYTEGPNGFGSGDFGPNVILPGKSLSGFGLTTPAAPDSSIAFATDEQFNQDATTATLPTTVPAVVPEASSATILSLGVLPLLIIAGCRRVKRPGRCV